MTTITILQHEIKISGIDDLNSLTSIAYENLIEDICDGILNGYDSGTITMNDENFDWEIDETPCEPKSFEAFEAWWNNEGSGQRPNPTEDTEEFIKRICKIAWNNGTFKANEIDEISKIHTEGGNDANF